jgi:hypothetical protein
VLVRNFLTGFGKFPFLVRAPQLQLRFMGKLPCMGWFLWICFTPVRGLDHFHNCLASGVHMNVLGRDLLLFFPSKHRAGGRHHGRGNKQRP